MMSKKVFSCHKIAEGVGEGEVIISKDEIMFYLVRPETGEVFEKAHDIEGKSVAKKALVFPGGKGSSVVQSDGLYQLMMRQNQPAAMIIENAETVLVAGAIIMEIPTVDRVDPDFYKTVKNGDRIRVDANNATITILD
jgi:predicted aconitase with swiveling domain